MSSVHPEPSTELQDQLSGDIPTQNHAPVISSLHPADGGRAAWLFLLGCFTIEMVVWSFPFSFGVLRDYYSTHPPISDHPYGISAVGTTSSGIIYLAAPLGFALFQRYPQFCRQSPFYGLPLLALAVFLSSFATKVWHLVLTQGVLYALGGGLLNYPMFIFLDEWFIRRKNFAYGIIWAGSGIGGLSGPPVLNWGLHKYGPSALLRGWALLSIGPLLYCVRPRVPISVSRTTHTSTFRTGFGFVRTRTFWVLQTGNIIQGLGYFIPSLYLPSHARTLGLSRFESSLVVSTLNTAAVPGVVLLSTLLDHGRSVTTVLFISAFGSALAVFLVWGLTSPATSTPLLLVFASLYGFFAGGFTATWAGTVKELQRVTPAGRADVGSIFGLAALGRGLGNILCGPISELLIRRTALHPPLKTTLTYDSAYGPLVIFTGTTAALALLPWVCRRVGWI